MIYVTIAEEKCTGRLILQLKGHAGAAPVGEDPVCAAASILTYTAAQFFGCLYAEGKLQLEPELRLERGDSHLSALPEQGCEEEVLYGLYVLSLGFRLLAGQYPQRLKLKIFGGC